MASQNTLTAPSDRDKEHLFDFNKASLTDEQVETAKQELVDKDHLSIYPAQERAFADPSIEDQDYCLVSFVPSVTATPDNAPAIVATAVAPAPDLLEPVSCGKDS